MQYKLLIKYIIYKSILYFINFTSGSTSDEMDGAKSNNRFRKLRYFSKNLYKTMYLDVDLIWEYHCSRENYLFYKWQPIHGHKNIYIDRPLVPMVHRKIKKNKHWRLKPKGPNRTPTCLKSSIYGRENFLRILRINIKC